MFLLMLLKLIFVLFNKYLFNKFNSVVFGLDIDLNFVNLCFFSIFLNCIFDKFKKFPLEIKLIDVFIIFLFINIIKKI